MGKIVKADTNAIKQAAEIIRSGGVVAFPTETVYGLGADAFNPQSVVLIYEIKNRPRFDPIIVHIADLADIEKLCVNIDTRAKKLIKRFFPGPLTLVLLKSNLVPDIVTAGLPTVAVRMPAHPIALELIKEAGTPIAAPSANLFGRLSPTTAEHVYNQLGDKIELILDGGPCPVGIESTVLSLATEEPVLLRPGGIPIEEIETELNLPVKIETANPADSKPKSPGQLSHHYMPKTPILLLKDSNDKSLEIEKMKNKKCGLLAFRKPDNIAELEEYYQAIEILSPDGNLKEAAVNFFACLHRLDSARLDIIYAEPVPEIGLGRAIMDRLRKAASSFISSD